MKAGGAQERKRERMQGCNLIMSSWAIFSPGSHRVTGLTGLRRKKHRKGGKKRQSLEEEK